MVALSQRNWYTKVMKFKKGSNPWNKGTRGVMKANSGSFKKGDNAVPLQERFEAKVLRGEDCWIWKAHKNNTGYGVIHVNGKVTLAHRIAYEHTYGPIPPGNFVLHTCDNPACVNPVHLTVGTQTDNMRDMSNKKRGCNGERAPWAKLTMKKAVRVRELYKTGNYSMRELAKVFNVSYFTINYVINNKRWV